MRLTPNAILDAPSYINTVDDRILVLRDLKIPILENLTVIKDIHDAIDLTNNDLKILGNFPVMTKLRTLLLARNRIGIVQQDIADFIPNLENLSLSSNSFTSLSSLIPLRSLKKLKSLTLLNNPITKHESYRAFVIWLIPQLQILDFRKIKDIERKEAESLFGNSFQEPTKVAQELLDGSSNGNHLINIDKDAEQVKNVLKKLTDEDKEKLKQELREATSLSEIDRIENALRSGYI